MLKLFTLAPCDVMRSASNLCENLTNHNISKVTRDTQESQPENIDIGCKDSFTVRSM